MFSKWVLVSLIVGYILPLGLSAGEESEMRPHPVRLTARHIEPNGIGYNQGYTTLEAFVSLSEPWNDAWFPFLDLRGHIFNNGKLAANAGLGLRFLKCSRIWGGNVYYDYRDTKHQHYNQVALGLEALGEVWDFRMNGYLPVGDKKSGLYDTKFSRFRENQILVRQRYQFAMKGINAEVGAHVDHFKMVPLYFAAGPYYLEGQGKTAWGGQVRAAVDISRYVRIEGNASYDNVFKWIGQGQLSVMFSFGPRKQIKRDCVSSSTELALATRALQRVDRNEIIPVDTKDPETVAVDPSTGEPYFVLFVDNTSHSLGTFESPFPTLTQAEGVSSPFDIIYVYSGSGAALAGGVTLKDSQRLFGASIAHALPTTLGNISIPPSDQTLPWIDSTGPATLILGNNNTVAGFKISNSGTGMAIHADTIANFTATENTLSSQVTGGFNQAGFALDGSCTGEFVFMGNTFTNTDMGIYVPGSLIGNLSSATNIFDTNSVGIYVNTTTITGNLNSTNDMFNMGGAAGIYVYDGTITGDLSCASGTFGSSTGIALDNGSAVNGNLSSRNNTFNTTDGITINSSPQNSVYGNLSSSYDTFNTTSAGINIPIGAFIGGTLSSSNGTFGATGAGFAIAGTVTEGSLTNGTFASNQGAAVTVPVSTTATWTMIGNTFTAEETGVDYPVTVANLSATASTSLIFNANSAVNSIYNLAKFTANGGTFDVTSESGNIGNISGP